MNTIESHPQARMETGAYGFALTLPWSDEQAGEAVARALQAQGFGVLTEIDVRATFQKKLNVEVPPYRILGACNPSLAYQALQAEPDVGLLLPCNVVVQAVAEGTRVAFVDPQALLGVTANPALEEIAREVRTRLIRVAEQLQQEASAERFVPDRPT